jgi:hypothetical protein
MKKFLALAAAGGALAIGVPAALAATDAPSTPSTPVQSTTPTPAPDQSRPDDDGHRGGRGDCPEHGSDGGSGSQFAPSTPDPTATPDV